jgi:hypothetical protein
VIAVVTRDIGTKWAVRVLSLMRRSFGSGRSSAAGPCCEKLRCWRGSWNPITIPSCGFLGIRRRATNAVPDFLLAFHVVS